MMRKRYRRWPSVIGSTPFPAFVGLGGVLVRGLACGAAGLGGWLGGGAAPRPGLRGPVGPPPARSSKGATPDMTGGRRGGGGGARGPARPHPPQPREGDHPDIDGVTEGAGLGPGLRHADQVREEETLDVAGVGITEAFVVASIALDGRLHDAVAAVLFRRLEQELGGDGLQAFFVGELQELSVSDRFLLGERLPVSGSGCVGLHGKASCQGAGGSL